MRRALALLALCATAPAAAQHTLHAESMSVTFADNGDLLSVEACLPDCSRADVQRHRFGGEGAPVVSFTSFATEAFTMTPAASKERHFELLFVGEDEARRRVWRIPYTGYRLELVSTGVERVDVAAASSLAPPPDAAGFGVWLEQQRYVAFVDGGVEQRGLEEPGEPVAAPAWAGFRNRFWAVMARGEGGVDTTFAQASEPAMVLDLDPSAVTPLSLYVGPIEPGALRAADAELPDLMYAGLWFWLRWICQALHGLLSAIHLVVPHWATAIVLLSVVVGLMMRPLSRIADRLQDQVHRTEGLLAPELAEIKRNYKGGEQSERIIALYKKHQVHPLYALKSLAGVAVVIPVFIGAFDMLAENIWLAGQPFLWMDDLARPDRLFALPFTIPFFGGWFNALPFIMTALSVWASSLHRHAAMDAAALRRHRINLGVMALAFLLLFYTFPAGMVLYWTVNNALSVIKYAWRNRAAAKAGEQPT